ncbi:transcriptional regulator [Schinkia azotoformans MEV2011]|uniref:Transcriptional regulator SinR n=2 Tax=Schinkia azotoformans TaxID=1454 RepID=K6DLE0_SCHAZ|nr:helix-turn-helix domain-containing protein [Schinkia azotoformans]EKN68973.1 transcriptional regulator SinR [Schinkia azotoformans LMG 9581]KEF37753.1 transcriptional regulator [Schinkia azotoformans MEV2011]MEC1638433.1 helix-turn-helix domain-containing protein [Schinkia azotoformans]MEC1695628.1 helix-turn-helix domain-containing protein [Schinkia azotoformans]MEC1717201.1 helix-turn-helix domain-containing protein [Schinkia azotoformans]
MIGKRIQTIRKEKGLSLSDLAAKAGIAKSYLSSIERDIQSNPSVQFLEKIAAVLDISVQSLINAGANEDSLDPEWIKLAQEAAESGVSKEQFREFLEFTKWQIEQRKNNENE